MSPSAPRSRRLTVAIIARDASALLPATLDAARALGDEMVVVETGSRDCTAQLAAGQGAKVIAHPWGDDFAAARNAALKHATGDWILWLDAGERLSPESLTALRQFVHRDADPTKVYMLIVTMPAAGGQISGEQIGRVRLMPNGCGLRFEGRVGENLNASSLAAGMTVEGLPWRILRSASDHDAQVKCQKAQRNLRLADLEIGEHGPQPQWLIIRAEALSGLGQHAAAAEVFRQTLAAAAPGSTLAREAWYGLLTTYDRDPAQRPAQINVCIEALEMFPLDAQLLCAMGGYLQTQGHLGLSERAYRTAAEAGQIDPHTWHVSDIFEIAAVCLSLTYQLRNNDAEALRALQEALARNAGAARVRRHLIDLLVKNDRRQDALAELSRLGTDVPHCEALRSAIRGGCLAAKQNWVPALAYLQTSYAAGCRDLLCLRWLVISLLATGDHESARSILETWRQIEPRSSEVAKFLATIADAEQLQAASFAGTGEFRPEGAQEDLRRDMPLPKLVTVAPSGIESPPRMA